MSIKDEILSILISAHIPQPRMETDIILKHVSKNGFDLTLDEKKKALSFAKRRSHHEPLDKILGYREFYKSRFKVNENVLTPRPDTEILVEEALNLIQVNAFKEVLDLGTGSGCILLSLVKEFSNLRGTGVDVSPLAIDVAKDNAKILGLENRVSFINKSWNDIDFERKQYDIIVSNPPYISTKDITTLSTEVKCYDPHLALDGGTDGYDCYKEIAHIVPNLLKEGGYVLLEAGYDQAENIRKIFEEEGLKFIKVAKDLAGIDRVVILKK